MTPEQLQAVLSNGDEALYSFAGALNIPDNKATVVQCTNLVPQEKTTVEVQLFNHNAGAVYTGTFSAAPMRTVTFESQSVPFYIGDVVMGTGNLGQGFGRILADHDRLICTVQVLNPENNIPAWSFALPLYTGPFNSMLLPTLPNNSTP